MDRKKIGKIVFRPNFLEIGLFGLLTPDPDAATSQSMRSSPEDSGDKAQTSSTEEVEIVATQASQGASQLDIWTSTAYYRPYNMALDPAIPVSPNSLSRRMTWASPTMRGNKWISQSLISPRPLIKSRTNDSWGNWGTTGSPDKPVDGFKSSSAIVRNV